MNGDDLYPFIKIPHVSYADIRLMQGDELRLRYVGKARASWEGVGHVVKGPQSILTYFRHYVSTVCD